MEKSEELNSLDLGKGCGIKEIMQMLPHRFPFLLVDRVISLDLEKEMIVAQKNVSYNEHFFQGHFPGSPIMPGVLVLEALAQTGGILIYQKGYKGKIPVIMSLNHTKFRHPVRPGDVLHLYCQGQHFSAKGGKVIAKAMVGNSLSVEAEIGFALLSKDVI
jgi:3-hydroxyacyl-[acyl-carrier-protein] dehydratase